MVTKKKERKKEKHFKQPDDSEHSFSMETNALVLCPQGEQSRGLFKGVELREYISNVLFSLIQSIFLYWAAVLLYVYH